LNKDGSSDIVKGAYNVFSKGKYGMYYLSKNDNIKIGEFSKRPFFDFYDINHDGYYDFIYEKEDDLKAGEYVIVNNSGVFAKEEKTLEEVIKNNQ